MKTTADLPQNLWRTATIHAVDDPSDRRSVIISASKSYLEVGGDRAEHAG